MSTRYSYPNKEIRKGLRKIICKILKPGRGILAADESPGTIGKHFEKIGVKNNKENRRCYRQVLFTTDPSISKYISGVILHDETVFQKADCGTRFPKLLKCKGIVPGIKVDLGTVKLYGTHKEKVTQGLDNLDERCHTYKSEGCDFAKWRATLKISRHTPTPQAIRENASTLARYASICQAHCIVPIVEPEVLTDGDHDVKGSLKVTETVLAAVMKALHDQHVSLENIILKPNMVTPGHKCKNKCNPDKISRETVKCLMRVVPPAVPGITFLSGGMGEEEATVALNNIAKCEGVKPWMLSFSFGRALQASALSAWRGDPKNTKRAQKELIKRARALSEASLGTYNEGSVKGAASETSLHVKDHTY